MTKVKLINELRRSKNKSGGVGQRMKRTCSEQSESIKRMRMWGKREANAVQSIELRA